MVNHNAINGAGGDVRIPPNTSSAFSQMTHSMDIALSDKDCQPKNVHRSRSVQQYSARGQTSIVDRQNASGVLKAAVHDSLVSVLPNKLKSVRALMSLCIYLGI